MHFIRSHSILALATFGERWTFRLILANEKADSGVSSLASIPHFHHPWKVIRSFLLTGREDQPYSGGGVIPSMGLMAIMSSSKRPAIGGHLRRPAALEV